MDRTSGKDLLSYMLNPEEKAITISLPDQEDLDKINFNVNHLNKFIELAYPISSDRTLTKVLDIAKIVKVIWNLEEEEALGKTAQLMFPSIEIELMKNISSPEKVEFKNELNKLKSLKQVGDILTSLSKLNSLGEKLAAGDLNKVKDYQKIVEEVVYSSENNILKDKYYQINSPSSDTDILKLIQ